MASGVDMVGHFDSSAQEAFQEKQNVSDKSCCKTPYIRQIGTRRASTSLVWFQLCPANARSDLQKEVFRSLPLNLWLNIFYWQSGAYLSHIAHAGIVSGITVDARTPHPNTRIQWDIMISWHFTLCKTFFFKFSSHRTPPKLLHFWRNVKIGSPPPTTQVYSGCMGEMNHRWNFFTGETWWLVPPPWKEHRGWMHGCTGEKSPPPLNTDGWKESPTVIWLYRPCPVFSFFLSLFFLSFFHKQPHSVLWQHAAQPQHW